MVARNKSKIDEKIAEIRAESPSIETMSIIADFGNMLTIEDYQTSIADKLKDLDVSVLVVNAGFVNTKIWNDISK